MCRCHQGGAGPTRGGAGGWGRACQVADPGGPGRRGGKDPGEGSGPRLEGPELGPGAARGHWWRTTGRGVSSVPWPRPSCRGGGLGRGCGSCPGVLVPGGAEGPCGRPELAEEGQRQGQEPPWMWPRCWCGRCRGLATAPASKRGWVRGAGTDQNQPLPRAASSGQVEGDGLGHQEVYV